MRKNYKWKMKQRHGDATSFEHWATERYGGRVLLLPQLLPWWVVLNRIKLSPVKRDDVGSSPTPPAIWIDEIVICVILSVQNIFLGSSEAEHSTVNRKAVIS